MYTAMHRPKTSTSGKESEMAALSMRQLQGSTADPIERLRLLCLSRGAGGILALGKFFRRLDDDGNRHLSFDEFLGGLKECGFEVNNDDANYLYKKLDVDQSGTLNMEEFILAIRPPMHASRVRVVEEAFMKLDKTNDGVITLDDLKHVYNVKTNPMYISGEESEEGILARFLTNFQHENPDGTVTKEEFLNYYSGISASIDNDCYFDLVMRQSYKL